MLVTPSGPTVYFDIDNTLVYSVTEFPSVVGSRVEIGGRIWAVEDVHVDAIKDFSARGHTIILWSAGGSEWCRSVAEALGITEYVAACLSKPTWYFDDCLADRFMPPNIRYYKGQVVNGS